MLGLSDLNSTIQVNDSTVACPVAGCSRTVQRQRRVFRCAEEFRCCDHGIYISPSTWEYDREQDNLLWHDAADLALLAAIKRVKRESRMARDNSEDAVTWNVFRFCERTGCLAGLIEALLGQRLTDPRLVYWSYSAADGGTWPWLVQARSEFGELNGKGSEPDLIVDSDDALIWIEAKITAPNRTRPSNPGYSLPAYRRGGACWFDAVFNSNPKAIAVDAQLYELMRFWLLGTWIAAQTGRDFHLVNLVRDGYELDVEQRFGAHIKPGPGRRFARMTWEQIYAHVQRHELARPGTEDLLRYFENKTIGYRADRQLQAAFHVSNP
jgi:hypothetical protein